MRLILDKRRNYPSKDLRAALSWMTLEQRRKMLRSRVVKRCLSGECPSYLKEMCVTNNALALARRGNDLNLPTPRSNFVQKSFTYRAGLKWNKLQGQLGNQIALNSIPTWNCIWISLTFVTNCSLHKGTNPNWTLPLCYLHLVAASCSC